MNIGLRRGRERILSEAEYMALARTPAVNPQINAVVALYEEPARESVQRLPGVSTGVLHGVPFFQLVRAHRNPHPHRTGAPYTHSRKSAQPHGTDGRSNRHG